MTRRDAYVFFAGYVRGVLEQKKKQRIDSDTVVQFIQEALEELDKKLETIDNKTN